MPSLDLQQCVLPRAIAPDPGRRRCLAVGFVLGCLSLPLHAQGPGTTKRIGLLWIASGSESNILDALRDALRKEGFVDGRNIRIEKQHLVERYDALDEAARNLAAERPDLIVCYGATATTAMSKATSSIPIVAVMGADPVRLGFATTLARPGKNITGVATLSTELYGKRLEVLKAVVPGAHRVAIVYNPESPAEVRSFLLWEAAGRSLNMETGRVEIRLPSEIDGVVAALPKQGFDALGVATSTMFVANRRQLVTAITRTSLPAIYGSIEFAEAGGLISYGTSITDAFARASGYVARILKGASAADLPFEQSSEVELVVNLKAAKAIGLTIAPSILVRANKAIE